MVETVDQDQNLQEKINALLEDVRKVTIGQILFLCIIGVLYIADLGLWQGVMKDLWLAGILAVSSLFIGMMAIYRRLSEIIKSVEEE